MARFLSRWFGRHQSVVDSPELLETEQAFYEKSLPDLLNSHKGEYVVIAGKSVLGFAENYSDALRVGYRACGVKKPFMVDVVEPLESASRKDSILFTRLECTN
jgi:hypothetical protein